jgi:glycosyltransferase involved in cell wall biosynthesis
MQAPHTDDQRRPDYERLRRLPEVALADPPHKPGRRPRLIAAGYGYSLEKAFSGSSWHLAQAGMAEGAIDGVFILQSDNHADPLLAASGAFWKARRLLQGRQPGGYKFAGLFQDVVWEANAERLRDTLLINNFQLYGRRFMHRQARLGVDACFYIDGTLSEYFHGYSQVEDVTIGKDVMERSIALERECYALSPMIVAMSNATARNLAEVYGVPEDRIRVVLPGANIDDRAVPPPSDHRGWVGDAFTVGFVGLYPIRKGLDKLAEAVRILRSRGQPIRLKVIGRCPDEIAAMDGVDFLGVINKTRETARFVEEIRACDLGCQISRADLTGIAMMEFVRVGVPVLATAIGGMPDMLAGGGGLLTPAEVSPEALAETLQGLMTDSDRYAALRAGAVRQAEWSSWRRTALELDAAFSGFR